MDTQTGNYSFRCLEDHIHNMTPKVWQAKETLDSTLHPGTGTSVFLSFRLSCMSLPT